MYNLYPEEQVVEAMKLARHTYDNRDEIFAKLTPIELPTEEEINERSYCDKDNQKVIVNAAKIARFRDGGKWVLEQITSQINK